MLSAPPMRQLAAGTLLLLGLVPAGGAGESFAAAPPALKMDSREKPAAARAPARPGRPGVVLARHPLGELSEAEFFAVRTGGSPGLEGLRAEVQAAALRDYSRDYTLRRGLASTPEILAKMHTRRTDVLSGVFYQREILDKAAPTPAELDAELAELSPQPLVYQIVVGTEQEAAAARARVASGEAFEEVAREVSRGVSRQYGGLVGYLVRESGHYSPEEEQLLLRLGVGELSGVVRGPIGYSVFWVKEIKSVEEQRGKLEPKAVARLTSKKVRELERSTLERLRAAAVIKLEKEALLNPPAESAVPTVVAYVDGEAVTLGSFGSGLHAAPLGPEDRVRGVQRYINKVLYRKEAERLGLDRDPVAAGQLEQYHRELLWERYLESLVQSSPVGKEELQQEIGPSRKLGQLPAGERRELEKKIRDRKRPKIVERELDAVMKKITIDEGALKSLAAEEAQP